MEKEKKNLTGDSLARFVLTVYTLSRRWALGGALFSFADFAYLMIVIVL